MDWKSKVIDEQYDGAAARFETAFAEAVQEDLILSIHWDDFILEATTLPQLKDAARSLIDINLGYLPSDNCMRPFEPFLRALIQQYWNGSLPENEFLDQVEEHVKLIRNADMKYNTCRTYDQAIYRNYHDNFAPFGYTIKSRLTNFLGYAPKLEHSLIAELWMRDIVADQSYILPSEMTSDDVRAMTLIRYREVLLLDGQQAANASPLIPPR